MKRKQNSGNIAQKSKGSAPGSPNSSNVNPILVKRADVYLKKNIDRIKRSPKSAEDLEKLASMDHDYEKSFYMKPLSDLLLPLVQNQYSDAFLCGWQRICGVRCDRDNKLHKNFFIHYFFVIISMSGEDVFGLMPFILWYNLDFAARVLTHFGFILCLGQIVKDMFHLPRPFHNKKIIRLEKCFETEYGFPSTHTMSGILPISAIISMTHNYNLSTSPIIFYGLILFAILVGCSRLYLGVHSPFDIAGGMILGFGSAFWLRVHDSVLIDTFYVNPYGIFYIVALSILFLLVFPRAKPWRAGYGTASIIFGPWVGCASAFWYLNNTQAGAWVVSELERSSSKVFQVFFFPDDKAMRLSYNTLDDDLFKFVAKRYAVATILLAGMYFFFRFLARKLFISLFNSGYITIPIDEKYDCQGARVDSYKAYNMEVPIRMLTFIPLAWMTIIGIVFIWQYLGL